MWQRSMTLLYAPITNMNPRQRTGVSSHFISSHLGDVSVVMAAAAFFMAWRLLQNQIRITSRLRPTSAANLVISAPAPTLPPQLLIYLRTTPSAHTNRKLIQNLVALVFPRNFDERFQRFGIWFWISDINYDIYYGLLLSYQENPQIRTLPNCRPMLLKNLNSLFAVVKY